MNFQDAQNDYQRLKILFDSGQISPEEFSKEIEELRVQDEQGNWWQLNPADGQWMYWDGNSWIIPEAPAQAAETNQTKEAGGMPGNTGQLIWMIVKSLPRAFIKSLPLMLLIMVCVYVVHTFLLVGPNGGFNSGTNWLFDNILVLGGRMLSGALFWMLAPMVIIAVIRGSRKAGGIGNYFQEAKPIMIKAFSPISEPGNHGIVLSVSGIATACILSIIWRDSLVSLQFLMMIIISLMAIGAGSFMYILARVVQSDGAKLLNKKESMIPVSVHQASIFFGGMAIGMLITTIPIIENYGIFIGLSAAIVAFVVHRNQGNISSAGGQMRLIIFILFTIGFWFFRIENLFADDGGADECGGYWNVFSGQCEGSTIAMNLGGVAGVAAAVGTLISGIMNGVFPIYVPPSDYIDPDDYDYHPDDPDDGVPDPDTKDSIGPDDVAVDDTGSDDSIGPDDTAVDDDGSDDSIGPDDTPDVGDDGPGDPVSPIDDDADIDTDDTGGGDKGDEDIEDKDTEDEDTEDEDTEDEDTEDEDTEDEDTEDEDTEDEDTGDEDTEDEDTEDEDTEDEDTEDEDIEDEDSEDEDTEDEDTEDEDTEDEDTEDEDTEDEDTEDEDTEDEDTEDEDTEDDSGDDSTDIPEPPPAADPPSGPEPPGEKPPVDDPPVEKPPEEKPTEEKPPVEKPKPPSGKRKPLEVPKHKDPSFIESIFGTAKTVKDNLDKTKGGVEKVTKKIDDVIDKGSKIVDIAKKLPISDKNKNFISKLFGKVKDFGGKVTEKLKGFTDKAGKVVDKMGKVLNIYDKVKDYYDDAKKFREDLPKTLDPRLKNGLTYFKTLGKMGKDGIEFVYDKTAGKVIPESVKEWFVKNSGTEEGLKHAEEQTKKLVKHLHGGMGSKNADPDIQDEFLKFRSWK